MAQETRINYQGQGFWIPEAFIEILSQFICETFEGLGLNNFSAALQGIYDDCDGNRSGEKIGVVNISFDYYINNVTDKANLISVLQQTKTLIMSQGTQLSISTLNEFESNKTDDYFKNTWRYPINTQSLAATIDIIVQVLNGTWNSDTAGVYYTGFPNPDGVSPI